MRFCSPAFFRYRAKSIAFAGLGIVIVVNLVACLIISCTVNSKQLTFDSILRAFYGSCGIVVYYTMVKNTRISCKSTNIALRSSALVIAVPDTAYTGIAAKLIVNMTVSAKRTVNILRFLMISLLLFSVCILLYFSLLFFKINLPYLEE